MIKSISINFPLFGKNGLKLNYKFDKGINIIEEENGFGKTTILNTIMSLYTGKFPGLKTLPDGTATIETDKDKFILSKRNWIGINHDINDLYQYCIPGKFFNGLPTTKQRQILIDLLDLDYNKYMEEQCNKFNKEFTMLVWKEDLEKELKSKLKDSETRSNIIVEDIIRLKSNLINFEEKDFKDVEEFYKTKELIENKTREYNNDILNRQNQFNVLLKKRDNIKYQIDLIDKEIFVIEENNKDLNKQLEELRKLWNQSNKKATCNCCGNKLTGELKEKVLSDIAKNANTIKDKINSNNEHINKIKKDKEKFINEMNLITKDIEGFDTNFKSLDYNNIYDNAKRFGIDIKGISESRIKEYEEYKSLLEQKKQIESELKFKEDQLKSINIIDIQNNLNKFREIKSSFTNKLEQAIKSLPLNIELFETLKNGNIKETFTIKHNGIDYYDLSQGNKMIVNILLSKIFIDKLGLDFILIDEANSISKTNIGYIKDLSKNYQIILFRATGWERKDFK